MGARLMKRTRRWLSRRLAAASIRVSPDPKLTFTTRRIDVDYPDTKLWADVVSGQIGRGIVGRGFESSY